jgi:alpha-tubulin suppressor-like RCC1 family protein
MNVSKVTQFELALLLRSLSIVKTKPNGTIASFFRTLMKFLQSCPKGSLSALWVKIKNSESASAESAVSLVDIPKNDDPNNPSTGSHFSIIDQLPELQYLKDSLHTEVRHDPLLFVRALYDSAMGDIVHSNNVDRCILLTTGMLLGMKSERISLILHSLIVFHLLKDDVELIRDPVLIEFISSTFPQNGNNADTNKNSDAADSSNDLSDKDFGWENVFALTPLADLTHIRSVLLETQADTSRRQSCHVLSCGKADHGKLGLGDTQLNRLIPTLLDSLEREDITKIASMSTYCLALSKSTGVVFLWGTGGTLGAVVTASRGDFLPQPLQFLPLHAKIQDISCGLGHALFLDRQGKVYSWGNGGNGRLGHGDSQDRAEACLVDTLFDEDVIRVQCGASHSLALTRQGRVFSWGKNSQGQCGIGNMEDMFKPHMIKKLQDQFIAQVTAGWEHSIALTNDGKMYSWGSGYKDTRRGIVPPVLGLGHSECRPHPELISSIEGIRIVAVASGWDHCMALDYQGKLLSWGSGQNGKLGHGNEENIAIPCYLTALEDQKVESFSAGCEHSACITKDGVLWAWGHGEGGRLGLGTNVASNVPLRVKPLEEMHLRPEFVHCGDKFTILITKSNSGSSVVHRNQKKEIESLLDRANVDHIHWGIHRYLQLLQSSSIEDTVPDSKLDQFDSRPVDTQFWEEMSESIKLSLTGNEAISNRQINLALMATLTAKSASHLFRSMSSKLPQYPKLQNYNEIADDVPFVVEHSEDSYCNFSSFLEILSGPFLAYTQAMLEDGSLLSIIGNGHSSKHHDTGYDNYVQDIHYSAKILYHLLILLATNLYAVSYEVRRRMQLYPSLDFKLLLEGRYSIANEEPISLPPTSSTSGIAKYDLSFLLRRDNNGNRSEMSKGLVHHTGCTDGTNSLAGQSDGGQIQMNYHGNNSQSNNNERHGKSGRDVSAALSAATSVYDQQRNDEDDDEDEDYDEEEDDVNRMNRYHDRDIESEFEGSQEYDIDEDNNSAYSSGQPQQQSRSQRNSRPRRRNRSSEDDTLLYESVDSSVPLPTVSHQQISSLLNPGQQQLQAEATQQNNNFILSPAANQSHVSTTHTNLSMSSAPSYESLNPSMKSSLGTGSVTPAFALQQQRQDEASENVDAFSEAQEGSSVRDVSIAARAISESANDQTTREHSSIPLNMKPLKTRNHGTSISSTEDDRFGPAEGSAADFEEFTPLVIDGREVEDFGSDVDDNNSSDENDDFVEDVEHTLQLQQALLLSIGPRKVAGVDSRLLGPVQARRGNPSIPIIRNSINNLASNVYMVLQQTRDAGFSAITTNRNMKSKSQPNNSTDTNPESRNDGHVCNIEELTKHSYRLWEAAQLATSSGWDSLYDVSEQKTILLQILRSPQSFLYIIPGIVQGLETGDRIKMVFSEMFEHQTLEQFLSDPISLASEDAELHRGDSSMRDLAYRTSSFIYFDDAIRVLEQFLSLHQTESDLRAMQEQGVGPSINSDQQLPVGTRIALSLHRKVCVSFGKLATAVLSVPIRWMRTAIGKVQKSYDSSSAAALESIDNIKDKFLSILDLLFDCCLLDIENTVSASVERLHSRDAASNNQCLLQVSSFLEAIMDLLFHDHNDTSAERLSLWSTEELNSLINFAGQFLHQLRKALDLLKAKTNILMTDVLVPFERVSHKIINFLCCASVMMLRPSGLSFPSSRLSTMLLQCACNESFDLHKLPAETLRSLVVHTSFHHGALRLMKLGEKVRFLTGDIVKNESTESESKLKMNSSNIELAAINMWMNLAWEEVSSHYLPHIIEEINNFANRDSENFSSHMAKIAVLQSVFLNVSSDPASSGVSSLHLLFSSLFRGCLIPLVVAQPEIFLEPEKGWKSNDAKSKALNQFITCLCILIFSPSLQSIIIADIEEQLSWKSLISQRESSTTSYRLSSSSLLDLECAKLQMILMRMNELFTVLNCKYSSHASWMGAMGDGFVSSRFGSVYQTLLTETFVLMKDVTNSITQFATNNFEISVPRLTLIEAKVLCILSQMRLDPSGVLEGLLWQELQRRLYLEGLRLVIWTVEVTNLSASVSSSFLRNVMETASKLRVSTTECCHLKNISVIGSIYHCFSSMIQATPKGENSLLSSTIENQLKFLVLFGCISTKKELTGLGLSAFRRYCRELFTFGMEQLSSQIASDGAREIDGLRSDSYLSINGVRSNALPVMEQVVNFLRTYSTNFLENDSLAIPQKLFRIMEESCDRIEKLEQDFTHHLWWCHLSGGKYLLPNSMNLEVNSPVVISATSSAHPTFTIAFWLRIPNRWEGDEIHSKFHPIHILSRIPETGDSNLYDIVCKSPTELDSYSLAVHLLWSETESNWKLQLSAITYSFESFSGTSSAASALLPRKKKMHWNQLLSSPIHLSPLHQNWSQFNLQIAQQNEHYGHSNVPDNFDSSLSSSSVEMSCTEISLWQVKAEKNHDKGECLLLKDKIKGGNWPLHQNMVIGKLPSFHSSMSNEKPFNFVMISDVLWISSTLGSNAESPVPEDLRISQSKVPSIHCPTSFPPSVLVESIQNCGVDIVSVFQLWRCLLQSGSISSLGSMLEAVIPVALRLVVLCPILAQQSIVNFLEECIVNAVSLLPLALVEKITIFLLNVLAGMVTKPDDIQLYSNSTLTDAVIGLWKERLFFARLNIGRQINAPAWLPPTLDIDDNSLFVSITRFVSELVHNNNRPLFAAMWKKLITKPMLCHPLALLKQALQGGYHPGLYDQAEVAVWPRAPLNIRISRFLHDTVAFPGSARIGISLSSEGKELEQVSSNSHGDFVNGLILQRKPDARYYAQEMQFLMDPYPLAKDLQLMDVGDAPKSISFQVVASLLRMVLQSTQQAMQKSLVPGVSKLVPNAKNAISRIPSKQKIQGVEGENKSPTAMQNPAACDLFNIFLVTAQLRSILVKFSSYQDSPLEFQEYFTKQLSPEQLSDLVQLAAVDPVESMIEQFEATKFRGVQTEVLRSLLREGDLFFLEKLVSKLWKLFGIEEHSAFSDRLQQSYSFVAAVKQKEALVQLVSLAGDIAVTGAKIRAISHFPSVKVAGVTLERMTGRWFYECTVLSDGLMQIGWANNLFRCDPVCGQGVGDHVQSWAFDGLRMKKWNVSCEPYGKRWRAGDVIGVLVDMDLLEMRFYLNGEDLGPAFEDFSDHHLYPALSLNVRQSVRLNIGQYQFAYPPDVIDGKSFRSVLAALEAGTSALSSEFKPTMSASALVSLTSPTSKKGDPSSANVSLGIGNDVPNVVIARLTEEEQLQMSSSPAALDTSSAGEAEMLQQLRLSEHQVSTGGDSSMAPPSSTRSTSQGRSNMSSPYPDYDENYFGRGRRFQREMDFENQAIGIESTASGRELEMRDRAQHEEEEEEEDDAERDRLERHEARAYALGSRWQEDFEARICMEAEDRDGGDDYGDHEEEDEEDEDDDEDEEDEEEDEQNVRQRIRRNDHHLEEEDDDDDMEDEEDRYDEIEDALGRRHRIRRAGRQSTGSQASINRNTSNSDRPYSIGEDHLTELRRQALIESLIGMGFPIELSLRAAAQSDITTSESAAIAWIIEQMENDHHDDNKAGEEDSDDEDASDGLNSQLRRHRRNLDMLGDESSSSRHDIGMVTSSPVNQHHPSMSQEMGYLLQRAVASNGNSAGSVAVANVGTLSATSASSSTAAGATGTSAGGSTGLPGSARAGSARGLNRTSLRGMSANGSNNAISASGLTATTLTLSNDRAQNRRLIAEHMADLLDGASVNNTAGSSAGSSDANLLPGGLLSPGSPAREESLGAGITSVGSNGVLRRGLSPAAALGLMLNDDAAYDAFLSSRLHAAAVAAAGIGTTSNSLLGLSAASSGSGIGASANSGNSANSLSFQLGLTSAGLSSLPNTTIGAAAAASLLIRSPVQPGTSGLLGSSATSSKNDLVASGQEKLDTLLDAYCEPLRWNDSDLSFFPVLVGMYYRQRRQDLDKQEVLSQIAELDILDMLPIIASCQYALCIFYARRILIQVLRASLARASMAVFSHVYRDYKITNLPTFNNDTSSSAVCSVVTQAMRQVFRQVLGVHHLPDRILPSAIFATETEEAKDRLPCISLFTSYSPRVLAQHLSILERKLFPRSCSTLAVCEPSSHDDMHALELFVKRIVQIACGSILQRLNEKFAPLSRNSNQSTLSPEVLFAEEMLRTILKTSLLDLDTASQGRFDNQDWIAQAGNLHNEPNFIPFQNSPKSKPQPISQQYMPQVLFAFWMIKLILAEVEVRLPIPLLELIAPLTSLPPISESNNSSGSDSKTDDAVAAEEKNLTEKDVPSTSSAPTQVSSWLSVILSPESFSQILKLTSSSNEALRYCVTDLAGTILSLVNRHVTSSYFAKVDNDPVHASGLMQDNAPTSQKSVIRNDPLLKRRSINLAITAIAAEYYVSAAKVIRMLQSLGARMKIECVDKFLSGRQVRASLNVLLQWQILRQQTHLDALPSYASAPDVSTSSLFASAQASYLSVYRQDLFLFPIASSATDLDNMKSIASKTQKINISHAADAERYLRVVQVSATSITIHWQLTSIASEYSAIDASKEKVSALKTLEYASQFLFDYNLYLVALCQHGGHRFPISASQHGCPTGAVLIRDKLDFRGSMRIDDLEPDTLYQILLRSDRKEDKELAGPTDHEWVPGEGVVHLSVMIATESEAAFGFQSESVSPNIVIGASHGLSLRNIANKKWSTARANVRLSAGVHRWDVHIDRCISKNIFIGVATREARLDNYVGCDPCGWAFLANKAIWHNKAKLKSYGELFRTGDTVTLTLDLNVGTLSFSINDRPLGVALEGLVGPLYPAFSLYNEEDQITVAPVRSIINNNALSPNGVLGSPSASTNSVPQLLRNHLHPPYLGGVSLGRSFAAEMLLDRLDVMRRIMLYLVYTPSGTSTASKLTTARNMRLCSHLWQDYVTGDRSEGVYNSKTSETKEPMELEDHGDEEFLNELCQRMQLWVQHNVAVRTVNVNGTIHWLLMSETLVREFSEGRFGQQHRVLLEKRLGTVVGVGSHRIWLRMDDDGELIPLTFETMLQMIEKNLFVPVVSSGSLNSAVNVPHINTQYLLVHDLRPLVSYPSNDEVKEVSSSEDFPADEKERSRERRLRNEIVQKVISNLLLLSITGMKQLLVDDMFQLWTQEDDRLLLQRLRPLMNVMSPFAISAPQMAHYLLNYLPLPSISSDSNLEKTETVKVLAMQLVRWFVLVAFNDAILSLKGTTLPLVSTAHSSHSDDEKQGAEFYETSAHHPSALLGQLRHLVFPNVKDELAMSIVHHYNRKAKESVSSMHTVFKEYDQYFQERNAIIEKERSKHRLHTSNLEGNDGLFDAPESSSSAILHGFNASSPLPGQYAAGVASTASLFSQTSQGVFSAPAVSVSMGTESVASASNNAAPGATSNRKLARSDVSVGEESAAAKHLDIFFQHVLPLLEDDQFVFNLRPSAHIMHEIRCQQRSVVIQESDSNAQEAWKLAYVLQGSIIGQLKQYFQRLHTIYMHTCHMSASSSAGPNPLSTGTSTNTTSSTLANGSTGNSNGLNPNGAFSGNHAHNITHSLSPYLTEPTLAAYGEDDSIPDLLLFGSNRLSASSSSVPGKDPSGEDNPSVPANSLSRASHIDNMKRMVQSVHVKGREPGHWEVILRHRIPAAQMYTLSHHHVHALNSSSSLDNMVLSSSHSESTASSVPVTKKATASQSAMSLVVKQIQALMQALPFFVRISPVDVTIASPADASVPFSGGAMRTRERHLEQVQFLQSYQQQLLHPWAVSASTTKISSAQTSPEDAVQAWIIAMGTAAHTSFQRLVDDNEHLLFTAMLLQRYLPAHLWSEYTTFVLFIETALAQAQVLLNDASLFGVDGRVLQDCNAGQASLVLHHMHDLGCLLGLALRLQLPSVHLTLPTWSCYELLAGHRSAAAAASGAMHEVWLESCILSLRQGILSMYPENIWALWSTEDVFQWLTPLPMASSVSTVKLLVQGIPPSLAASLAPASLYMRVRELRRRVQYAKHVAPQDRFIQCFWLALTHIATAAAVTGGGSSSGPVSWVTAGLDFLLFFLGIEAKPSFPNAEVDELNSGEFHTEDWKSWSCFTSPTATQRPSVTSNGGKQEATVAAETQQPQQVQQQQQSGASSSSGSQQPSHYIPSPTTSGLKPTPPPRPIIIMSHYDLHEEKKRLQRSRSPPLASVAPNTSTTTTTTTTTAAPAASTNAATGGIQQQASQDTTQQALEDSYDGLRVEDVEELDSLLQEELCWLDRSVGYAGDEQDSDAFSNVAAAATRGREWLEPMFEGKMHLHEEIEHDDAYDTAEEEDDDAEEAIEGEANDPHSSSSINRSRNGRRHHKKDPGSISNSSCGAAPSRGFRHPKNDDNNVMEAWFMDNSLEDDEEEEEDEDVDELLVGYRPGDERRQRWRKRWRSILFVPHQRALVLPILRHSYRRMYRAVLKFLRSFLSPSSFLNQQGGSSRGFNQSPINASTSSFLSHQQQQKPQPHPNLSL